MQKGNIRLHADIICGFFSVILSIALRQVDFWIGGRIGWACSILRLLIYISLFSVWGFSLWYRIVQKRVRIYLVSVAVLMVCWMVVRSMKYWIPFPESHLLIRTLWYCYYIFMILIPLLGLIVSFYLGKPETYSLAKWMRFLFIPSIALLLMVLTNDLHRLVFVFPNGTEWSDLDYTYGPVYWLVSGWILLCIIAFFIMIIVKCHVPQSKRYYFLPLFSLTIAILYCICYIIQPKLLKIIAGDMTSFFCLLCMAILESCIRCRLIQSNTHYGELFRVSGVQAKIFDNDYNLLLSSDDTKQFPKETLRQSENSPVLLDDGIRLCNAPIKSGHVVWVENMSEVYHKLSKLREINNQLSEEKDLLEAENEIKKSKAKVAEKNRLYDKVLHDILPEFQKLDTLLSENTDLASREKLKMICIHGTYIKRRCNLLIIQEDMIRCSTRELEYCLRESCEALSATGVECSFHRSCEGEMPIHNAVLLYDLVEELVEAMIPSLSSLFLNVTLEGSMAEIKLLADCTKLLSSNFKNVKLFREMGGVWNLTQKDDAISATLRLMKGGGLDEKVFF